MGLIRFRGHFPKGGYDVQNGIKQDAEDEPGDSSRTSSGPARFGWCWTRARSIGAVARELDLTPSSFGDVGTSTRGPIAARARRG